MELRLPLEMSGGERPLVELYLEPGVFSERCTEKLPFRVDFIHRLEFGEVSGHRVLITLGLFLLPPCFSAYHPFSLFSSTILPSVG